MQYISNYLYLIALTSGFGKKTDFFFPTQNQKFLKLFRTYDHLVRSLQPCVIWLTAAQTGGQYLREDHTPKIGMKFSCQFIDERSVSTRRKSTNWGSETHFFFFSTFLKNTYYCMWIYLVNIPNSKIHKRGYYSYLMVTGSWCIVMKRVPEDWFWGKRNWPIIC